jgi:phage-related protein
MTYLVYYDPDAVLDLEALTSRGERKATFTAVDKLRALGPKLVPPHTKSLKGEPGLYELRPRAGKSPVRPIYRRVDDEYVILAVAIAADKADFDVAVAHARARSSRYEA